MNPNDFDLPFPEPADSIPPIPTLHVGPPAEPCQCGELLAVDVEFRDELASIAMSAVIAALAAPTDVLPDPEYVAELAYGYASAMMAQRNRIHARRAKK